MRIHWGDSPLSTEGEGENNLRPDKKLIRGMLTPARVIILAGRNRKMLNACPDRNRGKTPGTGALRSAEKMPRWNSGARKKKDGI
ncbi:MAG: hypothetical protein V2G48_07885 [bacterium JZ-2024 1]